MTVIRLKRLTSVQWNRADPLLESGQQGFELDTGRYKIGDGIRRWSQLDFYPRNDDIQPLIEEAVANLGGLVGMPDFYVDDQPAILRAVSNGDGTHRLVVTVT